MRGSWTARILIAVRLLLENLPPSLRDQKGAIALCLRAMSAAMPLRAVYLFGSHARGDARIDSDVDLCVLADDAAQQIDAARRLRETLWKVWPRPPLTLIPITPERLAEKRRAGDHFFQTVFKEGVQLATEDGLE